MSGIFAGLDPDEKEAMRKELRKNRWAVYMGGIPEVEDETLMFWGQAFKELVPTAMAPVGKSPVQMAEKLGCMGSFRTFVTEDDATKFAEAQKALRAANPVPAPKKMAEAPKKKPGISKRVEDAFTGASDVE